MRIALDVQAILRRCATSEKANSRHSIGELLDAAVAVAPAEPALHSISRFARASSDGGTSSPRAFAVFKLITSSYLERSGHAESVGSGLV